MVLAVFSPKAGLSNVQQSRRAPFTKLSHYTLNQLTPALLACAPLALVRADSRLPALRACFPLALVRADARPPSLLAIAPSALVRAENWPPALLACAPLALVRADAPPHLSSASKPEHFNAKPLASLNNSTPNPSRLHRQPGERSQARGASAARQHQLFFVLQSYPKQRRALGEGEATGVG